MAITYRWANPEKESLIREGGPTDPTLIFAGGTSNGYLEFLESGQEPAPYVAPPEPEPLTTEEKVNKLLSDYGLTRDEMQAALEVKTSGKKAG